MQGCSSYTMSSTRFSLCKTIISVYLTYCKMIKTNVKITLRTISQIHKNDHTFCHQLKKAILLPFVANKDKILSSTHYYSIGKQGNLDTTSTMITFDNVFLQRNMSINFLKDYNPNRKIIINKYTE